MDVLLIFECRFPEFRFPERQFPEKLLALDNCRKYVHIEVVNESIIWCAPFFILLAVLWNFSLLGIFVNVCLVENVSLWIAYRYFSPPPCHWRLFPSFLKLHHKRLMWGERVIRETCVRVPIWHSEKRHWRKSRTAPGIFQVGINVVRSHWIVVWTLKFVVPQKMFQDYSQSGRFSEGITTLEYARKNQHIKYEEHHIKYDTYIDIYNRLVEL